MTSCSRPMASDTTETDYRCGRVAMRTIVILHLLDCCLLHQVLNCELSHVFYAGGPFSYERRIGPSGDAKPESVVSAYHDFIEVCWGDCRYHVDSLVFVLFLHLRSMIYNIKDLLHQVQKNDGSLHNTALMVRSAPCDSIDGSPLVEEISGYDPTCPPHSSRPLMILGHGPRPPRTWPTVCAM